MNDTSFSEIREIIDSAPNPNAAIVDLILTQLGADDPELEEIARLAAIPRRLDPEIVGVLRGSYDRAHDEALFDRLAQLSFIRERPDGELVYHESTREVLLANLRSSAQSKEKFDETNARLVDFYGLLYQKASQVYVDIQRVARILRRANPNRLAYIASQAEQSLIPPMLEMLYHATLLGGGYGYDVFVNLFNKESDRISACEALLVGIKAFLRDLAPEALIDRAPWLRLREGEIKSKRHDWGAAEAIFKAVLTESSDPGLRIEALGALGRALEEQSRLGEAGEAFTEQLQLSEEAGAGTDARRVILVHLGELRFRLGDLEGAAEALRNGVALDGEGESGWSLGVATGVLALAELEQGNRAAALNDFFAALDLVRSDRRSPWIASSVARLMIEYIRLEHRSLFEPLVGEVEGLGLSSANGASFAQVAADQIDRLTRVGHLNRARHELNQALAQSVGMSDPVGDVALLTAAAVLSEAQGSLVEAEDFWSRVIDHPMLKGVTREPVALALSNRGELRLRLGRHEEARADISAGRAHWKAIGHKTMPYVTDLVLADLALEGEGDRTTAARLLDDAEEALGAIPRYHADLLRIRAKLARYDGLHQRAIELLQAAIDAYGSLGLFERSALTHAEASAIASDVALWDVATEHSRRAEEAADLVRRWAQFRPSGDAEATALFNKNAMQILYGVLDYESDAMEEAAELLRRCTKLEPHNFWYHLNLGYVCYAQGSWLEALESFDAAVEGQPELQSTVVSVRALMCLDLHARSLTVRGDTETAISTYERLEQRLRERGSYAEVAWIRLSIGDVFAVTGQTEDAASAYVGALEIAERSEAHAVHGAALGRLAVLKAVEGNAPAAEKLFSEALARYLEAQLPNPYWQLLRDSSVITSTHLHNEMLDRVLRDLREAPEAGVIMHSFKPRLSAEMPPEWVPKESLTMLAPDGQANVIASSEPLPPDMSTEGFAEAQGKLLQDEFKGYEEIAFERATLVGGKEALVRTFAWTPDEGPPVTQIQLYYVRDGNGLTATATTPSEAFPSRALELRQILASIAVEDEVSV